MQFDFCAFSALSDHDKDQGSIAYEGREFTFLLSCQRKQDITYYHILVQLSSTSNFKRFLATSQLRNKAVISSPNQLCVTMMWKVRRNSKDTMSKLSSVGTSPNPSIKKLPKKSSLKRAGDGLDSDWSSVGSSSTSSQRSETYKCDHSSFQSSSAPSKSSSHSSEPSTVSPISSQSLDARVSAASRAFESSCSAGESVNRSQASANQSTRSASSSQKSKGVKFSVVEIRDYEREIGDNPSCSNGPPIG